MQTNNSYEHSNKKNKVIIGASVLIALIAVCALALVIWNVNERDTDTQMSTLVSPLTTAKPQIISERLKAKYEYNNDVVGWLTVPGTDIDEEVLQADDNDYYLRRTIDKENNIWGCYFVDYKCNVTSRKNLSRVTIIYGHSLKDYSDGKKFTQLKRFNNMDFCRQNQTITLSLLYEELKFQVFSISRMPIDFYYIEANPTDQKFGETLAKLYETRINFFEDVEVNKDDHILLLQTCTSDMDYRYIVAAKLIED